MRFAFAFLFLVGTSLAAPLAAQQTGARPLSTLQVGDTVRVWATSPAEQIGVVAAPVSDSLAIRRRDGRALAFPVGSLSHVDVQRGSRRSTARVIAGVLVGAGLGAVLGATIGVAIEESRGCDGDLCGIAGLLLGGLTGGVGGAIGGGILGARYKTRRWEQIYP